MYIHDLPSKKTLKTLVGSIANYLKLFLVHIKYSVLYIATVVFDRFATSLVVKCTFLAKRAMVSTKNVWAHSTCLRYQPAPLRKQF